MGRAKAVMKRIQDNRVRKTTFLHRRKGLLKKISDFSTICDSQSNACLIVYDHDGGDDSTPVIWPQNPTVVHSVLEKYECEKNNKATPVKNFDLEEFFEIKKKSVEDEIAKVKKEIINLKFPTWDPVFLSLGKERLGPLIAELDAKISACDQRVNLLKSMQESEVINANMVQEEEDISETQVISAPISPVIDGMVDSTDIVNGHLDCTNQVIDEMVDSTDQVNRPLDCTNQVIEPVDSDSGLEEWACKFLESCYWADQQGEPVDSTDQGSLDCTDQVIDEMVDSTDEMNGPLDCTNQVFEPVDSASGAVIDDNSGMVDPNVPLDCTDEVFEPVESDSGLEEWACKFLESDYWGNQQGEPVDSASGLEDWACKFPQRANQQGGDFLWWFDESDEDLFQNTPFQLQDQ